MLVIKNDPEYYRKVFNAVVSDYQELSTIRGTTSCSSLSANYFGVHDFPTICEFLADVEHIAERSLNKREWEFFNKSFLSGGTNSRRKSKQFLETLEIVQNKLGIAFLKNQLFPVNSYVKKRIN